MRKLYKALNMLREMTAVQGTDGNWDYNDYMRGMYNGMEYALSIFEDRQPLYKEAKDE